MSLPALGAWGSAVASLKWGNGPLPHWLLITTSLIQAKFEKNPFHKGRHGAWHGTHVPKVQMQGQSVSPGTGVSLHH